MNELELLTKENAAAEAQGLFDFMKQHMGMVPNIYATAAHSPNTLGAILEYSGKIRHGELSAKEGQAGVCT